MSINQRVCTTITTVLIAVLLSAMSVGCQQTKYQPTCYLPLPREISADFEAFAKTAQLPVARVPLVAEAPKVDGLMDEVYKTALPLSFSFLSGAAGSPTALTTVYVVSTANELCVFAICHTPSPDDILADIIDHDGPVWNDDCVELFLDPTNRRKEYMHVQVNSVGTTSEAKGAVDEHDKSWDPKMNLATATGKDRWVLELVIPFDQLGAAPGQVNRLWAANFNRMAYLRTATEDTAWSPTASKNSHVPERFGILWLDAGTVDNTKD